MKYCLLLLIAVTSSFTLRAQIKPTYVPDTTKIYNAVQVQPSFPGGMKAYDDFISKTMVYPTAAKLNGVSGRVFLQFIVERDGSLTNMKIVRDPGSGLGDEALRIMKLSPKWTVGVLNGVKVRVQFTVPINFSLY